MRNSGRDSGNADRPALDEVARTDLLLDALAGLADADLDDPEDDALASLLGEWRDDLRWPPASALVSPEQAVEALRDGLTEEHRGARRGLAFVGSVAASLMVLSGFGAMVVEARPGDPLYGLHAMVFNEPRVKDDQIALSAKADLAKVEELIAQGRWSQAQNQLAQVSSSVQGLNEGGQRQDLIDEVNLLNTRVESRNPNATLPPQAPPVGNSVPRSAPRSRPSAPSSLSPSGSNSPSPASPSLTPTASSPAASAPAATDTPVPPPTSTKARHHHKSPSPAPTPPAPTGPASGTVVSAPVPAP
jgi:Anti-sigma-D factor RsdA to sigma factor binding region